MGGVGSGAGAGAGAGAGVRGSAAGGGRPPVGLEFCATLLTNSSICAFSCVLLRSSHCAPGGGGGGGGGGDGQVPGAAHEGGRECYGGWQKRGRSAAGPGEGAAGSRLYCVIGSDNGFVQAWELSLDGEDGVGGQPLWSQKVLRWDSYTCSGHVFIVPPLRCAATLTFTTAVDLF